jgi:magnesium transporter
MIRSFYHHGAEQPATDLTPEQMRAALADAGGVLWVDLQAPSPTEAHKVLDEVFGFHPLSVGAGLDGRRPAGLVNFGKYLCIALHTFAGDPPEEAMTVRQVDCYLGPNFVVTHHMEPVAFLDRVAEQVVRDEEVMSRGAGLLAYELLSAVGEEYEQLLSVLSAAEAGLEVEILAAPRLKTLQRLLRLRREVLKLRRVLRLYAATVERLASEELPPIPAEQRIYFRELSEAARRLVHTVEYLRELNRALAEASLLVEIHAANRSLKRVGAWGVILLAVLAVIGLELAGLPEALGLAVPPVPLLLGSVVAVTVVLALIFYARGWL